jgi:hypothetical protein
MFSKKIKIKKLHAIAHQEKRAKINFCFHLMVERKERERMVVLYYMDYLF